MRRPAMFLALIGVMGISCSLSGVAESPVEAEPSQATGGGVPIAKSTPTTVVQSAPPTDVPPEPTLVAPATAAPGRGQPQMEGSTILEIVDATIIVDLRQLIGIVKNTSDTDIYNLGFTFNFHDPSGAVVETKYGGGFLFTIPAGSLNVFEIFLPANAPADAESVSVSVEWQEGQPSVTYTREGMVLNGVQGHSDGSSYLVTGEIQNITDRRAIQIKLLGIAFSSSGRLIGQSFSVVEDLAPGGVAPFRLPFGLEQMREAVGRYEVLTEARLED